MRKLTVLVGSVVALALAVAFSPSARAQQERPTTSGEHGKSPKTIQGVVAEITEEGEIVFDYRNNKAIEAEAAFLTVVGSPKEWSPGAGERATAATGSDKSSHSGEKRDNVYIVWLTPKTKVCKCTARSGGAHRAATTGSESSEKKECSLAQLEVGDRVEIEFVPTEESGQHNVSQQTEKMRQTHGRHRIFVGDAKEVTIIESPDQERAGAKDKP